MGLRRTKLSLIVFLLGCMLAGCNQGEKLLTSKMDPSIAVQEMNPERILIHFIGLDKGEATLIQAQDTTILIDTGAPKSWKALNRFLRDQTVKQIDYLFVTNDGPLWSGNMNQILNNYEVHQLVLPKGMEKEIMGETAARTVNILPLSEGNRLVIADQAVIEVLNPGNNLSISPQNNALVFRLIHGDNRFLFTSGIHEETELRLVNAYDLKSQILKVSDGGSIFGTAIPFIEEVDAHIAILFTYGRENAPGLSDVLERLEETWIEVYRIKQHGTVTVESLGTDYNLYSDK